MAFNVVINCHLKSLTSLVVIQQFFFNRFREIYFKKEKAGEFLAWSVKALLIIYIVQTIIRMIILEIQQRESDRIYFYLNSEEDENIKPFFGLWKNFTNKDRFEVDGYYSKFTTNCSGLRRVGINAIAALTLAKYDWINSNKS